VVQEETMRVRIAVGFTLLAAALANAAEPQSTTPATDKPAAAAPAASATGARPPLKLKVGDVRNYMMPKDYVTQISANDADKTIIVEGERQAPPLRSEQPQPEGLGAVYSLFRYPANAWRLFIPDPRAAPSGPPDPVPQREFRWGP
jgi:hypothetical protein